MAVKNRVTYPSSAPNFRSTTMPDGTVKAIHRRARQLVTLDHGELAVLLARLEYTSGVLRDAMNLRDDEDDLVEQRAIMRACEGVAAALAAIKALS